MSNRLRELETLAEKHKAVLTIRIDRGVCRASFKQPGQRAVVVDDVAISGARFPPSPVEGILQTLLERLGYVGLPTTDVFVDQMNAAQRQRCRELIAQLQRLRDEVLNPTAPSAYEPRLAPPRSSLHPQIVQGAPEPSPAALRKRARRAASPRRRRRRCSRE